MSHQEPRVMGTATPVEIELDREGRRLRFGWADGLRSAYDWEYLRWRCPCAWCAGEAGRPGQLEGRTSLNPDETEMTDVNLVGRYAVQPTWRDGHDSGIFTFRLLRALAEQEGASGGFSGSDPQPPEEPDRAADGSQPPG